MDSMTIAIVAFFFSLVTSVLSGYVYLKDKDSRALHFMLFAVMVFCFGVNSAILLFKLIIAGA